MNADTTPAARPATEAGRMGYHVGRLMKAAQSPDPVERARAFQDEVRAIDAEAAQSLSALREAVEALRLPPATCYRTHTQSDEHLGVTGAVWLADVKRALLAAPAAVSESLDVARLADMRDLITDWLEAERLFDTMNIDDGPAHQDAWDAVHFTRERIAAEYDRLRDAGR